ncbi:hypothetical protein ONV78_23810 [Hahella sp. CR1]|uniref:hypothetical protein n=1 Tax=Hahella sp. CR1 TaxID=2992807 RepID=UPI0024432A21|nr:hypothetical protein [Hahella sp. CR1]MDG9670785.1 hypothetical protein [Hahella sp. CR1]
MRKYISFVFFSANIMGVSQASEHDLKVCGLQVMNNNDYAFMQPCEGWSSKNSCSGTGPWIVWDMSLHQGKAMYSAALAAMTAEQTVRVRLDGSSCAHGYDVTQMIRVSK